MSVDSFEFSNSLVLLPLSIPSREFIPFEDFTKIFLIELIPRLKSIFMQLGTGAFHSLLERVVTQ